MKPRSLQGAIGGTLCGSTVAASLILALEGFGWAWVSLAASVMVVAAYLVSFELRIRAIDRRTDTSAQLLREAAQREARLLTNIPTESGGPDARDA